MAPAVPTIEPSVIVAGDTYAWTKSLGDYPASEGYSLSYAFRYQNGGAALDLTAAASGSDFSVSLTGASSSLLKPGTWVWASYVTLAGARTQVQTGTITVQPNLALLDSAADLRSPAKIAYDNALTAWQSVKLGQTVMLHNRTYTQHNLDALARYVAQCKADYQRELQAEQIAAGKAPGTKILVQFS